MVELYVLFNADNTIYRVSTVEGTGHPVKLQDDVIDFNKLEGYELNYEGYLVFNENKYNNYHRAEQAKEEYEQATQEFEIFSREFLLPTLSDEEAYNFKSLYPSFGIGTEYKVGERIMYNYKFYKVIMDHTSQADWTPDVAVSLFAEIPDPSVEYPEFKKPYSAETAYMAGDKITFEGSKYISTMDNNVYSPTEYPEGWELVYNNK